MYRPLRTPLVLGLAMSFAGALVFMALPGCATNPVSGKRQFSLVSPQQELSMGAEGNTAVIAEYGAYDDPRLAAYVDSVGQALAKVSHEPGLTWHFTVVDDPTVNAFALPGGYIYITRGILAHLNSEAQLAGVMGHEIGHVTARHSAQQVTQQQLAGLGLGLASALSPTFQRYGALAQQGLSLMFLKYSRADETQADELGVEYSTKAGWDSRQMPLTYQMLARVSDVAGGQQLPTFLSTHPDPGDRQARTTALSAAATQGKTNLAIRPGNYLSHVNNIVFGTDPRGGYFENGHFYHPTLGFELAMPAGWQTQNQKSAVVAAEPQQHGMMQLTIVNTGGVSPAAYVQQLVSGGKITDARGASETIGGFAAWTGRLATQNQDGTPGSLIAVFIQRSANETFQVLGQSAAAGDSYEAAILASARSFRSLSEASRRNPAPDRVVVVGAPQSGTFQEVLARLGPIAITPQQETVLNNLDLDATVRQGQSIKVVRSGSRAGR